jgi:Leucine-rich repeat (LRR) protein
VNLGISITKLTALQTLDISYNYIGAEGAVARNASLSCLTALQTLDSSYNGIGGEAAMALSASLDGSSDSGYLLAFLQRVPQLWLHHCLT